MAPISIICGRCLQTIQSEDHAKCNGCDRNYHFECSISENSYNKLVKNKKNWKCSLCTGATIKTRHNSNSNQVQSTLISLPQFEERKPDHLTQNDAEPTLKEVLNVLSNISSKIGTVDNDVKELKNSVGFMSSQYDNLLKLLTTNTEEVNAIKKEISYLKEQSTEKDSIIKSQNVRIAELEQRSRMDNLEIQGVSELPNENIYSVLESIGRAINCQVSPNDISITHRVQHMNNDNNKPRNIIVKFISRRKKEDVLAATKRFKRSNTNTGKPGITIPNLGESIFINEHLSSDNKQLLHHTKEVARNKNYKFVWVRNCTIHVRKNETTPAKAIKCVGDTTKM